MIAGNIFMFEDEVLTMFWPATIGGSGNAETFPFVADEVVNTILVGSLGRARLIGGSGLSGRFGVAELIAVCPFNIGMVGKAMVVGVIVFLTFRICPLLPLVPIANSSGIPLTAADPLALTALLVMSIAL